ncbi:hypothetical protein [Polaribacter sp. Z022]|uniref:hypothetical protein n=1 Tax=Polaribacter sp. Z022 TaxID=2927125 RepID=UPI002021BF55|nr:hypothetical protein [Polaribacter sp. Z022]MCL7754356.1 hypothetical protein [Polaribacter sp. Z022]
MKPFSLLFFVFSFCFSFSQTQKADLIFKDGDTISGYAMILKNNKINFRISLDDEPDKWTFLMVKRIIFYGFNTKKVFEYIKLNNKQMPILAEVFREGKVTLYKKLVVGGYFLGYNPKGDHNAIYKKTKSTTMFLKRENEEIATNLRGDFKKKSLEYFKDCKEIIDLFKDKSYLNYKIEDLVIEYNLYCNN